MPRKVKTGLVVSTKMDKSIVVEVTRTKQHPLYKKYIRVRKKFMAHDETNSAQLGDMVRIEECRPISKNKTWQLVQVVRHAHGQAIEIAEPTALQVVHGHGTAHSESPAPAPAASATEPLEPEAGPTEAETPEDEPEVQS
jgi:small subunit ribosomal protein S17